MAVVAHEYGHAISNRMVAGPDTGTGGTQGQTESWSDLIFAEYFRGKGISTGPGANPFALAPYVSGNKERGIRNYGMNNSPLNYSDLEYDGNGTTSPHADGEIWSAVNYDISEALNDKYDAQYPSSNKACSCAAPRACCPRPVPGQPALGADHVRRLPADADRRHDARLPRRDAGRRPAALRRRQPGRAVA